MLQTINLFIQIQKMHLNVKIQDHSFKLSIGTGHNDWAWLGHYAARRFSKISYPQGTYLPAQLYIIDKENQPLFPHPRQKIGLFLEENKLNPQNITAIVKIRKGNHVFTNYQKIWQNEAYGLERLMMNITYVLDSDKFRNKEGQRQFYFKVMFNYTMHEDIAHFFNDKKYVSPIQLILDQTRLDNKSSTFKGNIKLPFGSVSPSLYYCYRDIKDPSSYRSDPRDKQAAQKPDTYKISMLITPKYVSIREQNAMVSEQMKISQNITKSLQQKQLETNKRNISLSMCCYGFEQFWKLIEENHGDELNLEKYDSSTRERLKIILQRSLNQLYKIFFYYFTIQNQLKQKKQELGVTYQNIMHFLRFYEIFKKQQDKSTIYKRDQSDQRQKKQKQMQWRMLAQFLDLYNNGFRFCSLEDTVDIQKKSINFVQFVCIILRAISFKQSQLTANKGETFDVSVASVIDRIILKESQEYLFSSFKQNIRKNPNMIEFLRASSDSLKKIFIRQISKSIQKGQDKFMFMKEQFKLLLENSSFTHENTDSLVNYLFNELELPEEGVYYYQFIEAIQWLAMALVVSDKDEENLKNEEQETLLIIEKIKFFIEKVQS